MKEKELEKILKALANKRRIAIIGLIKNYKEASVGDIAEKIKLSFKSTSRHIGILLSADILEREQKGPQAYYRISPDIPELARRIISLI